MKRHGDALNEYSRFIKTSTKVVEVINFLVTTKLVHTKTGLFTFLVLLREKPLTLLCSELFLSTLV